jgi:hypothetical protein
MMEAASISETLVNFYQTTRRNNPQDSHLPKFVYFAEEITGTKATTSKVVPAVSLARRLKFDRGLDPDDERREVHSRQHFCFANWTDAIQTNPNGNNVTQPKRMQLNKTEPKGN